MPQLLDLPDEILVRIVTCLSDADHEALFSIVHANKRLNNITTPHLVRCWPPQGDNANVFMEYYRFALHLLRHPDFRQNVRQLEFHGISTRNETDQVELPSREELEQVAAAGLADWPALAELVEWKEQIFEGVDDAFAVLFLLWARNVESLDFTVPYFRSSPMDGDNGLLLMHFISQVARKFINGEQGSSNDQVPLAKLQSIDFKHWDTENGVQGKYAAPFFYLPRLRTFSGWMVEMVDGRHDDEENAGPYLTQFPVGTSNVEEIILNYSDVSLRGLSTLVQACRRLTMLVLKFGYVLENESFDSSGLAEILLDRRDSLQTLAINWDESPLLEITARGPLKLHQCLPQLNHLEYLELPISELCEKKEIDGNVCHEVILGRIPASIRYLALEGNIPWIHSNEMIMNTMIDSLDELLRNCGSDGAFPHMETVELVRILTNPDEYDLKARLEATSREKNVEVIFSTFMTR